MTANESTPGDGYECDGSNESTDSGAFEDWARRKLAAELDVQAVDPAESVREIADAVRSGETVDSATVRQFRKDQAELSRAVQGALMASPDECRPSREELANEVHDRGTEAQSAALALDKKLQNDEPITDHDVAMAREWAEELLATTDRIARHYQGVDR